MKWLKTWIKTETGKANETDWNILSPHNINALINRRVIRIKEILNWRDLVLIYNQILRFYEQEGRDNSSISVLKGLKYFLTQWGWVNTR